MMELFIMVRSKRGKCELPWKEIYFSSKCQNVQIEKKILEGQKILRNLPSDGAPAELGA